MIEQNLKRHRTNQESTLKNNLSSYSKSSYIILYIFIDQFFQQCNNNLHTLINGDEFDYKIEFSSQSFSLRYFV